MSRKTKTEALLSEMAPRSSDGGKIKESVHSILGDQVQAELDLKKAILAAATDGIGGPFFTVNRQYCYTSFNQQHAAVMKALFGAEIEIGLNLLDYHTNADDRRNARANIDRALAGESVKVETFAGEETHAKRYFEIDHQPVRDPSGAVIGAAVTAHDITDRKHQEADLLQARLQAEHHATELDATFNSIADGVMVVSANGHIQRVNQTALVMMGFDPFTEDISGILRSISMRSLDGKPVAAERTPSARALRGEKVVGENYIVRSRGQDVIVLSSATPIWVDDQIAGAVVSWHDVTAQRKADETHTWLASFPELNPNPIVELETDGSILYLNPAARELFPDLQSIQNEHPLLSNLEQPFQQLRSGGMRQVTRDQRVGDLIYQQAISIVSPSGRFRIYSTDITSRIQAELDLQRSLEEVETVNTRLEQEVAERRRTETQLLNERTNLQIIFNVVNVGMLQLGLDGSVKRANQVVTQWTTKDAGSLQGLQPGNALGCIHAQEGSAVCGTTPYCSECRLRSTFETALKTGKPVHGVELETNLLQGDSKKHLWLEVSADPVLVDGEPNVILAMNDITARKQTDEELRRVRDELESRVRKRTRELNRTNEQLRLEIEERKRMADSLHDAVNQSMFSAGLIAEVLPRLWDRDQAEARQSLKDLRRLTRSAQGEMRALLAELRPSVVTDNGLDYFMEQLSNAFSGRTNLPVAITTSGESVLQPDAQVVFYRVCQEALNNIAKHARATRVEIDYRNIDGWAVLTIRDDGRGFDAAQLKGHHYGLTMMQDRAKTIGADLSIDSHLGLGTCLTLTWKKKGK